MLEKLDFLSLTVTSSVVDSQHTLELGMWGEGGSPCNYSAEKRPAKCGVNLSDWRNGKAAIRLSRALNDSGAYSWTAVTLTVWDLQAEISNYPK